MRSTPATAVIATVVIATFGRPELLRRCLVAVANALRKTQAGAVEVIVVDDRSSARLDHLAEADYPWVRFVPGPGRGVAASRNCGARVAQGRWLVFTGDDCTPDPGWLAAFLRAIRHADAHELLEGRIRTPQPHTLRVAAPPACPTGGPWSSNMALTARLFRQLGGYCEGFLHPAMDDLDLRLRLQRCGHQPKFVPSASVCQPSVPERGVRIVRQHNASYRHLLERHPQLWQSFTWAGIALNAARLLEAARPNAWQHGLRGVLVQLYAAATRVMIEAHFKVLGARLTRPSAP